MFKFHNSHEACMHGHDFRAHGLGQPTSHRPGSPEKVAILRRRIDCGLELWHPLDAHMLADRAHGALCADMELVQEVEERVPTRLPPKMQRKMYGVIRDALRIRNGQTVAELSVRATVGKQYVREILAEMNVACIVKRGAERQCQFQNGIHPTWWI